MSARKTRSSTNLSPKEEIKRRKAEGEERNTLSEHSDFYESEEEEKPTYDLRALKLARRKEELAEERKKQPLSNKQVRQLLKHASRQARLEVEDLMKQDMEDEELRVELKKIEKKQQRAVDSLRRVEEKMEEGGEEEEDDEDEEGEIKIVRDTAKEGEKKGEEANKFEHFDLRANKEERSKLQPLHIKVGGGYWLRARTVSFVTESTSGSYEALSLTRDKTAKQKSDKDMEINMSIRLLPNFTTAVKTLAKAMDKEKVPTIEELIRDSSGENKESLDFTGYSSFMAPRMKFTIDAIHEIEGGEVKLDTAKSDMMQAVTVRKLPKENAKKDAKPFKLNVPLRYLRGLALAAEYISAVRGSSAPKE